MRSFLQFDAIRAMEGTKVKGESNLVIVVFLRVGISFPSTRRGVLRRRRDTILTRGRSWDAIHGMQIKQCFFAKRYHELK